MPLRLTIFAYLILITFLSLVYSLSPKIKKYRKNIAFCILLVWLFFVFANVYIYFQFEPFFNAIEMVDIAKIQSIINRKPAIVNSERMLGESPLHKAAEIGNPKVIELLLKNGAICNSKNFNRATPLHIAVKKNKEEAVVELIQSCDQVNAMAYRSDLTPLHLASLNGYYKIAKILVENGADITVKNRVGKTPLDIAEENDHKNIVDLLKEHRKLR